MTSSGHPINAENDSKRASSIEANRGPAWARTVLLAAAAYNILWGTLVVLFPSWTFELSGSPAPSDALFLWQCIGMIVGVYGIGYGIASTNPFTHWPIVLVGLLGKIFGPLGFVWSVLQGAISPGFGFHIIFNDAIWWIPFSLLLVAKYNSYLRSGVSVLSDETVLNAELKTEFLMRARSSSSSVTVRDLAIEKPLLLIFFRHAGCCFCRELLEKISLERSKIEANANLGFVFMEHSPDLESRLEALSLTDVPKAFDPEARLYRSAGMQRAALSRLFGLAEILRGVKSVFRFGLGNLAGDGFMLAGSVLIEQGRIVKRSLPSRASEHPSLCLWSSAPNI